MAWLGSKLAGMIGVPVAIVLALLLAWQALAHRSTRADLREMTSERDALVARIEDPDTGYIAQLATCRTNVTSLRNSLETQNTAVRDLEARTAAAEQRASAARAEAARLSSAASRDLAAIRGAVPGSPDDCEAARILGNQILFGGVQ